MHLTPSFPSQSGCSGRPIDRVNCSHRSQSVYKGNNSYWDCTLVDEPQANLVLVLNKTIILQPSKPGTSCRNDSEVIFYVEQTQIHTCFGRFKVIVLVCSADYSMMGEYSVRTSGGSGAPGSTVVVKVLEGQSTGTILTAHSSSDGMSTTTPHTPFSLNQSLSLQVERGSVIKQFILQLQCLS